MTKTSHETEKMTLKNTANEVWNTPDLNIPSRHQWYYRAKAMARFSRITVTLT
jgi:hypothetical protein